MIVANIHLAFLKTKSCKERWLHNFRFTAVGCSPMHFHVLQNIDKIGAVTCHVLVIHVNEVGYLFSWTVAPGTQQREVSTFVDKMRLKENEQSNNVDWSKFGEGKKTENRAQDSHLEKLRTV
ncbi:hypothetical protein Bca4012_037409 [Brassica carinata]